MYQAPDFVKVSVKAKDVFAGYLPTGCPMNEFMTWDLTVPCEGTADYHQVANTYVGLGWADTCYSKHNP